MPPLKAKRKSATKLKALQVQDPEEQRSGAAGAGGLGLKANGLKHAKHATSKSIICCKEVLYTHTHTHTHPGRAETKWQSHQHTPEKT